MGTDAKFLVMDHSTRECGITQSSMDKVFLQILRGINTTVIGKTVLSMAMAKKPGKIMEIVTKVISFTIKNKAKAFLDLVTVAIILVIGNKASSMVKASTFSHLKVKSMSEIS